MQVLARATLLGIAIGLFQAPQAYSGAFQLNERSAVAQGTSFAGSVSSARDVTFAGFNPAALTTVERFEIGGNLSLVIPKADGTIETGPAAGGKLDADKNGIVPAAAVGYQVTDDLILGISAHSPFGLKTEYSDSDPVIADAIESELTTILISPMVAYEVMDSLTIGASLDILYADANLTNAAVDLEGHDWGVGFSVGALFEPIKGTKIGAAYHHGYNMTVDTETFLGFDGKVDASLPNWIQVGITQDVTDDFRIMAEGRWINWSKFDSIDISTPDLEPTRFGFVKDEQNYMDAFFVAVGAEYDFSDRFTIRGGIAYDETPTTDAYRTVRVPDEDRLWFSAGASYNVTETIVIDAAYSYLYGLRDADVTLRNGPLAGSEIKYKGGAHIVSIGATFRF